MCLIYVLFICIAHLWVFNCFYVFMFKCIFTFFSIFVFFLFSIFIKAAKYECAFLHPVCQENLLHLRKQLSLYYEFCHGCSIRAFAENKAIMTKPQTVT